VKFSASIAMIVLANAAMAQLSPAPKAAVDQLIPWLLDEDQQLRGVPFAKSSCILPEKKCSGLTRTTQSISASQKQLARHPMKR